MPRAPKNQWDFGDLFGAKSESIASPAPVAAEPAPVPAKPAKPRIVLSVSELTGGIKRQLEQAFGSVWVSGEVSNLRLQPSGHAYFVLKDAHAQLNCVAFRGQVGRDRAQLKDGVKVTLGGELTVYEPRGQYQLRVTAVELEGMGALQAAFERLKAQLQAEGLFDPARKRPLPPFPRRIGLVTSPTGAAIRDVLHVVGRRFAGLEFVLVPVRVQGEGAAFEIAQAIAQLNEWAKLPSNQRVGETKQVEAPRLDAILITRGGGSLEDLWAFNEEIVARAIAASTVPVISAVGHEIDFTIADFTADLRAATPSAAAELLTAGYVASADQVATASRRLRWLVAHLLDSHRIRLESLTAQLARRHPRRPLETRAQKFDDLCLALGRRIRQRLREMQVRAATVERRLSDRRPGAIVTQRSRELDEFRRRLLAAGPLQWKRADLRLDRVQRTLELLSPLNILSRGYSLTFTAATGRLVRRSAEVPVGTRLRTRLANGELESVVDASSSINGSSEQNAPRQ